MPEDLSFDNSHDRDANGRRERPTFLPPEPPPVARRAPDEPEFPPPPVRAGPGSAVALAFAGVVAVVLLFTMAGVFLPDSGEPEAGATPFAPPPGFAPAPEPSATKGKPAGPLSEYDGTPSKVRGRIKDRAAGLSYAKLGEPWQEAGADVRGFTARQFLITEQSGPGNEWYAEVASMPLAADHKSLFKGPDSLREVAEAQSRDLQVGSYPHGSRREEVAGERLKVSGRRAWLTGFRLTFTDTRFTVTDETVVVVAVDTGKKVPGILYTSIPGTREELRPDINTVVSSLQVLR